MDDKTAELENVEDMITAKSISLLEAIGLDTYCQKREVPTAKSDLPQSTNFPHGSSAKNEKQISFISE